jgi:hypothetical protein
MAEYSSDDDASFSGGSRSYASGSEADVTTTGSDDESVGSHVDLDDWQSQSATLRRLPPPTKYRTFDAQELLDNPEAERYLMARPQRRLRDVTARWEMALTGGSTLESFPSDVDLDLGRPPKKAPRPRATAAASAAAAAKPRKSRSQRDAVTEAPRASRGGSRSRASRSSKEAGAKKTSSRSSRSSRRHEERSRSRSRSRKGPAASSRSKKTSSSSRGTRSGAR